MTEFNRVIGRGLINNIDVSKRISNFHLWYMIFAVAFVLFYLSVNAWRQKEKSVECEKVRVFLDHFMVVANCGLVLRCITYFHDEEEVAASYQFSSYAMFIIIFVAMAYMALQLDQAILAEMFGKLCLTGVSLSYPIAIFIAREWSEGRVLLGTVTVTMIFIFILCKWGNQVIANDYFTAGINTGVYVLSLIPLMTSVYIELIHVLNQYRVFVAHPAKYYKAACALLLLVWLGITLLFMKKKLALPEWKTWAFPVCIFGITCLSRQIPISSTYYPDLFEGANASILISDFLNFGKIPNVEHYGGHMMSNVWEGILYGVVNQDYAGAVVSPYSILIVPVLSVLFYYLVKHIWNDTMALFVTLLFPFYSSWCYYGLGMLVCLAVMAYVKKNTYIRGALIWAAFIWCALYRLDLGFAFGIAAMISLTIYLFTTRNRKAARELVLTLIGWGIAGIAAWIILCSAKGLNPLSRLMEFLMVNLSNQNWANSGIGNTGIILFGWSYIIIPFLVAVGLLYTVFSPELRGRIGMEKWILLQIFGWCYFANFSRGLVRHSLGETATYVVIWSGYLFLALFVSNYKNNSKWFLPVFITLILCNTSLVTSTNFSAISIADEFATRPASILESWKPGRFDEDQKGQKSLTYWEQLKKDKEVVQRVMLDEGIEKYIKKYEVLDSLLEDGETFVDFINKTFLYSVLNRECPVYISQSPLQLSGEFMQTAFIKEIEKAPLVLMPVDAENFKASNSLDNITNAYRYYKVAEYIYQNYRPLYQYGWDYAVWCRMEQYKEYKDKLSKAVSSTEYIEKFRTSDELSFGRVELIPEGDAVIASSTGIDPMVMGLQNVLDISPFIGREMMIVIEYETDVSGAMQVFYTKEEKENYQGDQVETVHISGKGKAVFIVPITEHTKLRLDTPEKSQVKLTSLVVKAPCDYIDYGYDGPTVAEDKNGNITYEYTHALHNHFLGHLPRIWAEGDKEHADENPVLAELEKDQEMYRFNPEAISSKSRGNYLKISACYDGNDRDGAYKKDDETLDAEVIFGWDQDGKFVEKYRYKMTFREGKHDYLIRCSTDYYWYLNQVNTVRIQADDVLNEVEVKVLEGD